MKDPRTQPREGAGASPQDEVRSVQGGHEGRRRFEVILFDADGTLFDFERAEGHALAAAFADLGEPWSDRLLPAYQRINANLWRELEKGNITTRYLRTERFARFCREVGSKADATELAGRYLARLGEASFLLDGAEGVIRHLSGRHRLAIITNGLSEVQHARISRSPLCDLFEAVIVSEEVGVQKPEAGIFQAAFDVLRVTDRSRAIMVGDSLSSDIQGGANFGIATCWLNRRPEAPSVRSGSGGPAGTHPAPSSLGSSGPRPDWEISDLRELLAIVEDSALDGYNRT